MARPTPQMSHTDQICLTAGGVPSQVLEKFAARMVNRWDTYAAPDESGKWRRVAEPLTLATIEQHLIRQRTIGLYERCNAGLSKWGCIDADDAGAALHLRELQARAVEESLPLMIESSRRGRAHGWLWLKEPMPAADLRAALQILSGGRFKEIFPKAASDTDYGNLVRVPGGMHPKTGLVYPFEGQLDCTPSGFASYIAEVLTVTAEEMVHFLSRREPLLNEIQREVAREGSLIAKINAQLHPVQVLGWFKITPRNFSEAQGRLSACCPFHADDNPSLSMWRMPGGRWRGCCKSDKCKTYRVNERGQQYTFDLLDLIAMKMGLSLSEAVSWVGSALGIIEPGPKRALSPQQADGYSCRAFERTGWRELLPEIVSKGYRALAELEREYGIPAFGERTARAAEVVRDYRLPDERPWLILTYRRFAERLTGSRKNVRVAGEVLRRLRADGLIEFIPGKQRGKGAPDAGTGRVKATASYVLRVWPIPLPTSRNRLRSEVDHIFPGATEVS